MLRILMELVGGIFAALIVLASYIYFNSDLDTTKKIEEFDTEDAGSDEWYDRPTYTVSYVLTIVILVAIVIFYDFRW